MAGLPQFPISTQTDPYWEIPMYDAAGNPLSIEGRVFEAWIAPAQTKQGVAEPVAAIKVLTFQDGMTLVPPTDGVGDQTIKNTLVHQVSREFAQANFPRGELTADLLEVVDGARRMFSPVRLFYLDPAQIREFVADRAGITFGPGRQPIVTPVAIAGQAGRRGSGFLTGAGSPTVADGEDGDYWIDASATPRVIYGPKAGGAWPAEGEPFVTDLTPEIVAARDEVVTAVDVTATARDQALTAAEQASTFATQAVAKAGQFATLAALQSIPAPTAITAAEVVADGQNNGSYQYNPANAAAGWVLKTKATVPGLTADQRVQGAAGAPLLTMKNGVYPLAGEYVALDKLGRLLAVDFVTRDSEPIVIKNGIAVFYRDKAGEPLIWYDCATRSMRMADGALRTLLRGGYLYGVEAGNGDLISAIGADGQHYQPAATAVPVPFAKAVNDGGGAVQQIHLADGTRARRLTCAPVDTFNPVYVRPGLIRYARADGRTGLARAPIAPIDDTASQTALSMLLLYGQSLALGSVSYAPGTPPLLLNPPSPRVLMFNGGVRPNTVGGAYVEANFASLAAAKEALDGSTQLSETGLVASGFALTREVPRDILVYSAGQGGTAYAGLKKGTQNWTNMLYGVQRGKALADAASRPFAAVGSSLRHGESDEDKTFAQYLSYLDEVSADQSADIVAITGQAVPPKLYIQQINRMDGNGVMYGPGQAQFTAGTARVNVVLTHPQYVCDFGDLYHMLPESYQLSGSYLAKAVRRTVYEGQPFKPLYPTAAKRSGRVVTVDFSVPHGRLAIDTTRVSNPGNYGVVFRDSADETTGSVSVAGVELHPTNPRQLLVTLTGIPTGPNPQLGFAWWRAGTETLQGRAIGPRTCIRDTDPEACPATGLPLHNYCIASKVGVN